MFLWKVVKHQAQSLNGSFSILTTSWNDVNLMALHRRKKKTNKKNLIGSVKINKVTPTKKKKKKHGTVFPYRPLHRNTHSSNETSSASLHPYARASHHHHHHHLLLCVNISNEEPISGQQPLQHWWYLSLWYDELIADQFSQSKAAFLPLSPKIIALLRLHQYSVFVYWPPFISAGSFFLKV